MKVPHKENQNEKEQVQAEQDLQQNLYMENTEFPEPFKTKEAWEQYQMGEIFKDENPYLIEIRIMRNYHETWESLKTTSVPEGAKIPEVA